MSANIFNKSFILLFLTLSSGVVFANGPCVNIEFYNDFDNVLSNQNIKHKVKIKNGSEFVCWESSIDATVKRILDSTYGKTPDDTAVIINEPSLSKLEYNLSNSGISFHKYLFMGDVVIDWHPKDDDEVSRVLRETLGVDMSLKREESLKSIERKKN